MSRIRWALAATLLLAACQKESSEAPRQSGADILTTGQWRITAVAANPPITVLPGTPPISDLYNTPWYEACTKDDYFVFKKDGTLERNEGPTKCSASDPQTNTGTWSLSSDEKELTLDGTKTTVLELTANRMRLRGQEETPIGTVTAEVTFTQ